MDGPGPSPGVRTAAVVRRAVTVAVFTIAGLSFAFGFGNGWALGVRLGVSSWTAPLVAPAVDLSVIVLLASVQYLRASGVDGQLRGPRMLLAFCGLVTLALNTAQPLLTGEIGRACFDAVAPVLLIGWSEVGPGLLGLVHGTVPDGPGPQETVRDEGTTASAELLASARQLDSQHRAECGRPITRDKLRAQLKVSNAIAGVLLRALRESS
jgi:hypothetical protein